MGTIPGVSYPPILGLCERRKAGGAIIISLEVNDPAFTELVESGFPCTLVDVDLLSNSVAFVMSDNVDGAVKIVHHLGQLGRKRIAFIGGRGVERPHVDRHFGYQSELARLGLEYRPEYVATANWLPEPAYAEMKRMLALPEPPDAVFCASDVMAIIAMAAIEDAGLRVPEDVAVAGFDDIEYARLVTPALTTVRQDRAKMAEAVMNSMLHLLEHPDDPPPVSVLPVELIVRESTTPRSSGSDALLI
jgi:LacI family transcriptional regulator